jgi:NAD(P)-dependent dehydrogenase (short-subunit alcohol dehydrogenase family)
MSSECVVLVTGASSGFGLATAEHLAKSGYCVFGTSRRATALAPYGAYQLLPMDVDDDESVRRGVEAVLERAGRIDVVVNNAGIGYGGAVEDTSIEEARAHLETNFFGAVRVCRAVLPTMRGQGSGTIVNISSIAGLVGIPFQAFYSASKFALEGFSEALRLEVQPFGIRVVLVEPGDARTGFTANRRRTAASLENPAYRALCDRALAVMEADEEGGFAPELLAHLVERIIRSRSPRLRYTLAPLPIRLAATLKKVVPSGLFEWGLARYYGLR